MRAYLEENPQLLAKLENLVLEKHGLPPRTDWLQEAGSPDPKPEAAKAPETAEVVAINANGKSNGRQARA